MLIGQKVGRNKKYHTEEERRAARTAQQRERRARRKTQLETKSESESGCVEPEVDKEQEWRRKFQRCYTKKVAANPVVPTAKSAESCLEKTKSGTKLSSDIRSKFGTLTNGSSLNEAIDEMKCIVEGCSTKGLPPDNNYCLTRQRVIPWMRALGHSTENVTIDYDDYICQKHFDQSQYSESNLKTNAIPTLRLPKNKRSNELNMEEIDHEFALAQAIIKVETELEAEEMPSLSSYYSQLILFYDLIPSKKELAWRLDLLGVKYKEDDLSEDTNVVDISSKQSAPVYIEAPTYFETTLIDDPDDEFVEDEPAYVSPSRLMQEIETYETESATEIKIKQEIQIYEPEPITEAEIKQEIQICEPEHIAEVKPEMDMYVKPVDEIMIVQKEEYILPKRKKSSNKTKYDNGNDDDPIGDDDDDVDDPDYKDVDDPEYDFMDDDDDPDYDPNDDDYDDILYKNKNKNLKQIGNKKWPKLITLKPIEKLTGPPKCEIQPKIEIKKEVQQPVGNQQIQSSGNQRIQSSNTSVNQIIKPSVEETKKIVSEKMLTEIKIMDEKIQSQVKHIITKIDSAVREKGVAPTLDHYYDQVKRISNANISKDMLKRQLVEDKVIFIDDEYIDGDVDFVTGEADSLLISEIRNIENQVRYMDKVPTLDYFYRELEKKFKSKAQFSDFPFTEKMVLNWLNELNIQCQDNLSKYPSLDYFYMELESRGFICPKQNIAILLKQIKIKFWEEDGLPSPEKLEHDKDELQTALFDINTQFYNNKEIEEYVQIEAFRVVHPKNYVTKCIAKSEYHFYSAKETPTEDKFCQRLTEEFGDICSKNVMKQWLNQLGVGNRNPRGFKDIPTLNYFCEQLAKQHDQKYSKYLVRKWLIESSIVFEYEELDPLEKDDSNVKAPGVTLLLKNLNADYYKIDSEIIQTIRRVERGDNKFKVTPNFSAIYEELRKAQSDLTIEKVEIWLKRLMVKYIPDNSQLTTLNKKLCYPCLVPPLDYFYERLVDKLGVFPKKSLKKWLDHLTILYYPSDTADDLLEENITLNVDIVKMLLELENEHESFSDVSISDIIRPIGMNFKDKKIPTLDYIYKYVQSAKLFCNKKSQYADCKDTLKHWLKVLRIDYTDTDERTKTVYTPLVANTNVPIAKTGLTPTITSSPGTKLNSTDKTMPNAITSGSTLNSTAQIPPGTKLIKLTDCPTLQPNQTETTNGNRSSPMTTQTGSSFPQMVISDIRSVSPAVGSPASNQIPTNYTINSLKPDSKGVMVIPREVKTLLREGFFKNIKREFYARNQQPSLDYIHTKLKEKDYFFSKIYLKKLLNYLNISFEDTTDLSNEQDDNGSSNSSILDNSKDKEVVNTPSNANKNETNSAKTTTRDTSKRKASSETSEATKEQITSPPRKRRGRPRKVDQENSKKTAETTKSKTNSPNPKSKRGRKKTKDTSTAANVIEIGDSDDDTGSVASKKRKRVPDVIEIPDEEADNGSANQPSSDDKSDERTLMSVFDEVRAEFFKKSGVPKFNDFYTRVIEYFGDQYSSEQVKEGLKEYAENLKR